MLTVAHELCKLEGHPTTHKSVVDLDLAVRGSLGPFSGLDHQGASLQGQFLVLRVGALNLKGPGDAGSQVHILQGVCLVHIAHLVQHTVPGSNSPVMLSPARLTLKASILVLRSAIGIFLGASSVLSTACLKVAVK